MKTGILNRATEAKQTHEEKTEEEKLKLGVLALSTEYRSQTTHTYPKFSGFVESKKSELEIEIGATENSINVDTEKDILQYREKKYTLDNLGGITDYVEPQVGKFQTLNGVAYYYTESNPTDGTPITASNMGQFLGKKVVYVADPSTSSSRFSDRATETTYRIFYIDVGAGTGKYGDGAGTIYLKQDCDEHNLAISTSRADLDTLYNGLNNNYNKMPQLNPDWRTNDNSIDSGGEELAAYLCNTEVWQAYKDPVGIKQIARYVVGAPTVEMWVDSYNAFIDYNTNKNLVKSIVATNNGWTGKLETRHFIDDFQPGYMVGMLGDNYSGTDSFGNRSSRNDSLITSASQINTDLKDRVSMYNESTGSTYWLASPYYKSPDGVVVVKGENNCIQYGNYYQYSYYNDRAFCPLISCNSEVEITEEL